LTHPEPSGVDPAGSETIEELFAALESHLLLYAQRLTREPEAAEDLVQEAFLKLHSQFEQVRAPRRWLYRTVHNSALNHLRKAKHTVPFTLEGDDPDGPQQEPTDPQLPPDAQIVRWEGIGLVRLSLETLDDRSRELVRLKFNESLSYKEISARTGLTIGHVGYLLHHALKAVAAELAKNGLLT